MSELGCAEEYTVAVFARGGQTQLGELADTSAVAWDRVLDDISEASVTIPYQGPDCCDLLESVWPWCHEIGLYRDGRLVWQGPVEVVDYGRDTTTISAKDVSAWLVHRVIKTLIDYSATGLGAADLATIAETIVRHGLQQDDPNVEPYLTVALSGITGERKYPANGSTVYDELAELARTGVDFTTLGRRLILRGETAIARLAPLTDEHFAGELHVIKDGRLSASAATVVGKNVIGTAGGEGVCGLLETLATEQEILDTASAAAEAEAIVAAGTFPVTLQVPDGSQLDPSAPVDINELIPGVIVPVASSETCYQLATDLRLKQVSVSFGTEGEKVGVNLVPVGA